MEEKDKNNYDKLPFLCGFYTSDTIKIIFKNELNSNLSVSNPSVPPADPSAVVNPTVPTSKPSAPLSNKPSGAKKGGSISKNETQYRKQMHDKCNQEDDLPVPQAKQDIPSMLKLISILPGFFQGDVHYANKGKNTGGMGAYSPSRLINKELQKRILSSTILVPITIFFIFQETLFFAFFLCILFIATSYEWIKMNKRDVIKIIGIFYIFFA